MKHDTKIGLRACIWMACCIVLSLGCIALAHHFIEMIESDIPYQKRIFWYQTAAMVAIPIVVAFAQAINSIAVHSWATWLAWLGSEDMCIIIIELFKRLPEPMRKEVQSILKDLGKND